MEVDGSDMKISNREGCSLSNWGIENFMGIVFCDRGIVCLINCRYLCCHLLLSLFACLLG